MSDSMHLKNTTVTGIIKCTNSSASLSERLFPLADGQPAEFESTDFLKAVPVNVDMYGFFLINRPCNNSGTSRG